jgi:hypothetical protein
MSIPPVKEHERVKSEDPRTQERLIGLAKKTTDQTRADRVLGLHLKPGESDPSVWWFVGQVWVKLGNDPDVPASPVDQVSYQKAGLDLQAAPDPLDVLQDFEVDVVRIPVSVPYAEATAAGISAVASIATVATSGQHLYCCSRSKPC